MKTTIAIMLTLLLVVTAGTVVAEEKTTEGSELPSKKASIAVMAFKNMSGKAEQDFIGDGISIDIQLRLSKIPYLFVIASESTFFYKEKSIKRTQVAQELGVKYLLEGNVLKSAEQVRINAQLINTVNGNKLWTETYEKKLAELLPILDEIALAVAKSLSSEIDLTHTDLPKIKSTDNVEAWLLYQRATFHWARFNKEDTARTINLTKKAIEIDPEYVDAYSLLANALTFGARFRWVKSPTESMKQAKEMALKAIEIDDSNSFAHETLGELYLTQRNYDDALVECKKAADLDHNSHWANWRLARCLLFSGQPKEALPFIKKAMRLSPRHSWDFYGVSGRIYFHTGRYEHALTEYDRIREICEKGGCNMYFPNIYFAMVYGRIGKEKEARSHMQKVLEYNPRFNLEARRRVSLFKNKEDTDREIEGLRKAGAPEHPPSQ